MAFHFLAKVYAKMCPFQQYYDDNIFLYFLHSIHPCGVHLSLAILRASFNHGVMSTVQSQTTPNPPLWGGVDEGEVEVSALNNDCLSIMGFVVCIFLLVFFTKTKQTLRAQT